MSTLLPMRNTHTQGLIEQELSKAYIEKLVAKLKAISIGLDWGSRIGYFVQAPPWF